MEKRKKRVQRQRLLLKDAESREIICKTFHFLKSEYQFMKDNNHDFCDLSPLAYFYQRTADATGVGRKTLTKLLKEHEAQTKSRVAEEGVKVEPEEKDQCGEEEEDCGKASSSNNYQPPEKRLRLQQHEVDTCMEITSRIANAIRATMHSFITKINQEGNEKNPKLKTIFSESIGFDGSEKILRRTLFTMGYRWLVGDDGKKNIVEKHNIQIRRYRYLKDIIKFREKNMTIVYTGAKVVHRNTQYGQCHTVFVAGTHERCLFNTFWIYTAAVSPMLDREYNINQQIYHKWLTQYLLPNLPNNCVVVVNNAPYNNEQCFIPTETEQLKEWLITHNITFDHDPFEDLHRMELLDLVVKNKERFPAYKSDYMISQLGHIVLRLPPKHPELNAIEGFLEMIKTEVKHTLENDGGKVWFIIHNVANNIEPTVWHEHFEIVKRVEGEYLEYFDNMEMNIQILEDDTIEHNIKQENDSDSSDKESLQC